MSFWSGVDSSPKSKVFLKSRLVITKKHSLSEEKGADLASDFLWDAIGVGREGHEYINKSVYLDVFHVREEINKCHLFWGYLGVFEGDCTSRA